MGGVSLRCGGFGGEEDGQDDAFDGEHAEGGFLAVPGFGLPHEEPLGAYAEEGDEPLQHAGGEREDADAPGVLEDEVGGAERAEEGDGSPDGEDGVEDLPGDDAEVEGDVDPAGVEMARHMPWLPGKVESMLRTWRTNW